MSRPDARLVMRLRQATGHAVLLCQKMLQQVPEEHQERYVILHEQRSCGDFYDPIEADPNFTNILIEVDAQTQAFMESKWKLESEQEDVEIDPMEKFLERRFGDSFWSIKKRLLQETYGINWRTPEELAYRHRS